MRMVGQVVVQAPGSAYPMTQAQVSAQGNAELYAKLGQANQDLQSAQLTSKANANGTTSYTVVNGAGGNQASVLRFLPVDLTVKAGDSVTWLGNDPLEIHSVTFYDPAGKVPEFIVPHPQPSGPPKLVLPHAAPENDTEVDSPDLYNSGILGPGQSYTFTFPKPGVYTYVCVVHAPQGMFGKVIVEAAGPPASLPRTAEGTATPWLLLLGVALLLIVLGALARGSALRRRGPEHQLPTPAVVAPHAIPDAGCRRAVAVVIDMAAEIDPIVGRMLEQRANAGPVRHQRHTARRPVVELGQQLGRARADLFELLGRRGLA
jgi:plastocyanin